MGRALGLALVVALTACDEDSGAIGDAAVDVATDTDVGDASPVDASPDAHPQVDAMLDAPQDAAVDGTPANIVMVPCAGSSIAVTIFTSKSDYYPEVVSIRVGEIVEYQPLNPHDVVAGTFAAPQTWFMVRGNTIGCVRFDEVGEFPFFCTAHPFSMTGRVTVEP